MSGQFDCEINLLCIGDVLSGKSSFLQKYTESSPQPVHYKVYPLITNKKYLVYLHEVEEREGMDAYFSYPFDGVLYFLNISDFHNPRFAILDQLVQISKVNGSNIFKIPLKVVVLPTKKHTFESISAVEKINLIGQLKGMVDQSMVEFVEDDQNYKQNLNGFYQKIQEGEAPGISECIYVNWQLKGLQVLFPFQGLALSIKKMKELIKRWLKLRLFKMLAKKQPTVKNQ